MELREILRNKVKREHWNTTMRPLGFEAEVGNVEGEEILMHYGDVISYYIISTDNYYEFNMMDMFWDYIPFEGTFLDIGANIGNHSLMFNRLRPDVTIHSFEPIFKNYILLHENTKNKPNIKTYHVGLGSINEFVPTTQPSRHNSGGIAIDKENGVGENIIIIPGDAMKIRDVSFIKMDVEGYELNVLQGLNATITKYHPNIWIEDFTGEAVEWLKREHGYEIVMDDGGYGNYMMVKQDNECGCK
jgi:FkbM family methyltransferase